MAGDHLRSLGKLAKMTLPHLPAVARKFWDDNWQYIIAGVTTVVAVGLLFTPLAPAGVLMLSGMVINGGIELLFQAFSGEPLDKKALANAISIGGWSNLVGGAFISGTMRVGSKLMTLANRSGATGKVISGISTHLNQVWQSLTRLGSRATGAISKVQNQVGRSLAPLGNVAHNVTKAGRSMVSKVPVVNAVANRFTAASNQLARASAQVTGVAYTVGNAAESTVSNVADYAVNVPVGDQSVGGYVQAVAAVPVSSLTSSYASSRAEKLVRKANNNLKVIQDFPNITGDYVNGFTDSVVKTEPEDISIDNAKNIVANANRDGAKEVIKGMEERALEK